MFNRFDCTEHIPLLSEMSSKMLVLAAENNFETSQPKKKTGTKKRFPLFHLNTRMLSRIMKKSARNGDWQGGQRKNHTLQNLTSWPHKEDSKRLPVIVKQNLH